MKLNIPEGQRKLIATVITMAVGLVADKYFGGLSDNLTILIGSALALFVGGNAMEYVAQIKAGKPSVLPQKEEVVIEDETPVVSELTPADVMDNLRQVSDHVMKLDNICGQVFKKYDEQFKELQEGLELQANNTKSIIGLINKERKVNEGPIPTYNAQQNG